jgi:hypothetical protein
MARGLPSYLSTGPISALRSAFIDHSRLTASKNETPKMALGDGQRKRHIRDRSCDAETRSNRANAPVPRAFDALIRNQLERPDWLAEDAVRREPVSAPNSLLTGN